MKAVVIVVSIMALLVCYTATSDVDQDRVIIRGAGGDEVCGLILIPLNDNIPFLSPLRGAVNCRIELRSCVNL